MERLHRHSDGSAITLTGESAIQILRQTGKTEEGVKFFEYKPQVTAPIVRVEWDGDFAVIPTESALPLLMRGYARHATDIQVDAWNDAVDKFIAASAEREVEKPVEPPAPPVAQTPAAPVEQAPAQTPPTPPVEEKPAEQAPAPETASTDKADKKKKAQDLDALLKKAEAEAEANKNNGGSPAE